METKLFELRDHGTFIPLLCIKVSRLNENPFEAKMAWRYGYSDNGSIIVTHLAVPERGCHADPFEWRDRTFHTAHLHVAANWDKLRSGDLIDVRILLGETTEPCASEA